MSDILRTLGFAQEAGTRMWLGAKQYICAYWDGATPAAIAAGSIWALSYDTGANARCPIVIAPVMRTHRQTIVVAPKDLPVAAGWYWFQIRGECNTLCDGGTTDIGIGDYLQIASGAAVLTVDHATVQSYRSVAVAKVAYTSGTAALKSVYLIGDPVFVDGGLLPANVGQHGEVFELSGKSWTYAYSAGALAISAVQRLTGDVGDGTLAPNIAAILSCATTLLYCQYCVLCEVLGAAGWTWVQTKGVVDALLDGTNDVAVGDFLEVLPATTCFILDHAATENPKSAANSLVAYTTNATIVPKSVHLLGRPVQTAAT
jgi:hypothetical protein